MVQWLGLQASNAKSVGLILGQGIKIPHGQIYIKKKKKINHSTHGTRKCEGKKKKNIKFRT